MGGADKGLAIEKLVETIRATCKRLVLLKGTGSERIGENLTEEQYRSLEEAVRIALSNTAEGDTVLFSPGFASFGMFKNEYDRNDRFLKIVESL